jgi:hypothetical protein
VLLVIKSKTIRYDLISLNIFIGVALMQKKVKVDIKSHLNFPYLSYIVDCRIGKLLDEHKIKERPKYCFFTETIHEFRFSSLSFEKFIFRP